MRQLTLPLLLTIFISLVVFTARAQTQPTCDGSLGDPIINEDFGSGANPGPALASGITTLIYDPNPTTSNCTNDGEYSILNTLSSTINNCHPSSWHDVLTDHTGNPNGYMMLINASESPSIFFTQQALTSDGNGLCPSTTYQFSAYILNLIKLSASGPGVSEPDITFSIETTDGTILATYDTGTIPPTNNPTWVQESVYFTTPNTGEPVIVKMTNNAPGGNGNDLILDDITFRACGPVIQTGFSVGGSNSSSTTLCQGASQNFTLTAQVVGNNNPSYQWQYYNTTNGWTDLPGANSSTYVAQFVNAQTGTYQYRVGVANGSAITSAQCRVYSDPLTVNVYPLPTVTGVAPTQPPLCVGDNLTITASGGVTYQWTLPDGSTSTVNPLVITNATVANAGTYSVIAYSQYNCQSAPVSTQVTVGALPVAEASGGTSICQGISTPLSASGGTTYSWSPGITLSDSTSANPIATPTDTTTYTVTVSNNGCTDKASVTVDVIKTPIANAGSDKVIFEGQSVRLTASEKYGSTYSWTPTTGLSDPTILNPVANPTDDITYTLTVSAPDNCGTASSSVFVKVYKKITIPNTFSPNGDGINDYWDIDALITYPDCVLTVFDRYGQQVYHSIGYGKPWNGTYNGSLLPTGTYYYVLDLKNNTPKISGWVAIIH